MGRKTKLSCHAFKRDNFATLAAMRHASALANSWWPEDFSSKCSTTYNSILSGVRFRRVAEICGHLHLKQQNTKPGCNISRSEVHLLDDKPD
jgi:hypothetical protein